MSKKLEMFCSAEKTLRVPRQQNTGLKHIPEYSQFKWDQTIISPQNVYIEVSENRGFLRNMANPKPRQVHALSVAFCAACMCMHSYANWEVTLNMFDLQRIYICAEVIHNKNYKMFM